MHRISKTDTSALFRPFLGYRAEKKVTTRNSPANPLVVSQPEMQPLLSYCELSAEPSNQREFIEEKVLQKLIAKKNESTYCKYKKKSYI